MCAAMVKSNDHKAKAFSQYTIDIKIKGSTVLGFASKEPRFIVEDKYNVSYKK